MSTTPVKANEDDLDALEALESEAKEFDKVLFSGVVHCASYLDADMVLIRMRKLIAF
jgi:hypothetical protein